MPRRLTRAGLDTTLCRLSRQGVESALNNVPERTLMGAAGGADLLCRPVQKGQLSLHSGHGAQSGAHQVRSQKSAKKLPPVG